MHKSILVICSLYLSGFITAQNVGIGITTPKARLHVADSSVVFSATGLAMASPGNPPLSGNGRRMMWYADKGAFRVGYASGDSWDKSLVGDYSFVAGYASVASGSHSFALGLNNTAKGISSLALGYNAVATTDNSIAIGTVSFATGFSSTAIGIQNFSSGRFASAFGYNNISRALGGTVVGMFNDANDSPNPDDTAASDRIFQVGNGYYSEFIDDDVRQNALTILRDGRTGIGTTTPAASALLDLSCSTKGFLPPRMDSTQRNAIVAPATGLTIYNTSVNGLEVYNGTGWHSTVHYIGESYGGGIVFFVYDNGQHGLVAATSDQNAGAEFQYFCCVTAKKLAKANGIGAGLKNTLLISAWISQLSAGPMLAATACNEYSATVNGVTYGDWYLPSKYELNLLYLQKGVVGGFANVNYWSSTEIDNSYAWAQNFVNSAPVYSLNGNLARVRAIRAF
ncbi:MAG: hypothetical protein V4717_05645 [Bacteroidota bacterium]